MTVTAYPKLSVRHVGKGPNPQQLARASGPGMTYQTGPNTACPVRREGDELVCVCGLRWDAKEERPACPR